MSRNGKRATSVPWWILEAGGARLVSVYVALDILQQAEEEWASIERIAETADISAQTAVKRLRDLEAIGALRREPRRSPWGAHQPNRYVLAGLSGPLDSIPSGA